MISNYIKSLLDIHSRVIVPDLGAFMLKGDASRAIYFNEFLRFNDGLLIDYITDQEKIDKIEAAKKVKAFVDNANKLLLNNKSVELQGLGTLYLDVNEKIQLKTSENMVPPVKPEEPEAEPVAREILFELEKTEPTIVQAKTPESEPLSVPKPPEAPPAKPKTEPLAEASVKEVRPVEPQSKPREVQPATIKETKIQLPPPPKNDEVIDIVPTTTRRMVIVGIIGILIVGAIVYFAFFKTGGKDSNVNQNITIGSDSTSGKKDTSVNAKITEVNTSKPEASKKVDKHKEQPKTEPSKTDVVVTPKVTSTTPKAESHRNIATTTEKKFYVVAGTFSVESNADKMFKKLKEQGFQPDKIRNDTKNVFYVSFSSFTDKASASEEMKKLKSSGTDAWIYAN